MSIERVKTGIPGFDSLVSGGLVGGSMNLLCGETGTGKSTFALNFLWNGLAAGDNCVYATLEESDEEILTGAGQFGWDFDKFIKAGRCAVKYFAPEGLDELKVNILDQIRKTNAKRMVIDNLSLLSVDVSPRSSSDFRRKLFSFIKELKKEGVTMLLISEIPEGEARISRWRVEEFVADSVIILYYMKYAAGSTPRSLLVRKMRMTKHDSDIHPFEITEKGVVVK